MSAFDKKVTKKNIFAYHEEGLPFKKLSELMEDAGEGPFELKACWICKTKDGSLSPVAVIEGANIWLPEYKVDDIEDFITDDDTIADINSGKCGFKIYTYEHKKYGKQLGVSWVKLGE